MVHHVAKWDDFCAIYASARARDGPPDTHLLVLLDLVEVELHIAALMSTLMLHILDHGECEQALALAHGNPTCGTGRPSLPGEGRELRNLNHSLIHRTEISTPHLVVFFQGNLMNINLACLIDLSLQPEQTRWPWGQQGTALSSLGNVRQTGHST